MPNSGDDLGLDDMSVFLAVVEERGFRAASKRLRLSPSTVSDKISAIERRLGVPLLTRTTRSVMPTEAGRELASRLAGVFAEARAALQDAANSKNDVRGLLRLNVTGAVMVDILPPLLDRFLHLHPHVRVEIVVEDRLVDVVAAGCDAGIRYGEHLAQDVVAVPIGPAIQRLAYAAAPSYLEAWGTPLRPEDVNNHAAIRLRFSSGALVDWEFERGGESTTIDVQGRLTVGVDAVPAAIQAARDGHGIIGTFENWLVPCFDDGSLLPVLEDWWPAFGGPQLYFSSRFVPTPLRALIDLVTADHRMREP
ncbi:LysR family transcriptional regulator [Sphingomonas sp. BK580]|uniref:LysR family transcriptional regulator n=1 Tax=Sphingomonas sp. BK580 TaxID=2586972 RepID=UPI00161D5777|nr:LysR family transcriptional regulator [Sphingomonas sp. BK580]MBB3693603.1 DNA-binding transcriptional LysR family regulator [Sphingomonas sp. BK580]